MIHNIHYNKYNALIYILLKLNLFKSTVKLYNCYIIVMKYSDLVIEIELEDNGIKNPRINVQVEIEHIVVRNKRLESIIYHIK